MMLPCLLRVDILSVQLYAIIQLYRTAINSATYVSDSAYADISRTMKRAHPVANTQVTVK